MAIVIPTDYDPILPEERIGLIDAGKGAELLDRILDNANWFYGNYCPPLVSMAPYSDTTQSSHTYHIPVNPSEDGLDYTVVVRTWSTTASAGVTVDVDFKTSTTDSNAGSFGASVLTINSSHAAANDSTGTGTITLASNVSYLRIEVVGSVPQACQLQHLLVYPKRITTASTGVLSSGAILYDSTLLTATGAPVNTEMINRVQTIVSSVRNDRTHNLFTFADVQPSAYSGRRPSANAGTYPSQTLWKVPAFAPGALGETCVFYCRGATSTGTTFTIRAGDGAGGHITDGNALPMNDTDRSNSFTLKSEAPHLWTEVDFQGNTSGALTLHYAAYNYTPSDSTADIVSGATPPALLEYLLAANHIVERAAARAYTCPGLLINSEDIGATYWYWTQITGPGSTRQRMRIMKSIDAQTTSANNDPEMWSYSGDSGTYAAQEKITAGSPWGAGADTYPYRSKQALFANFAYMGSSTESAPSAAGPRMAELTSNRYPYEEIFRGRYFHGVSGAIRVQPVKDW